MFKLAKFLKPYTKELIIGPTFKLVEAILELLLPTVMAIMINNGVDKHNTFYVMKLGGIMLVMAVLGFCCSLTCQYFAARTSQGFGTNLRNVLFNHISSLSYSEIDSFGTPSLINRLTNDVNQLQLAVAMLIRLVIRAPFICIGAVIMSMLLDFKLSLILLASIPVFGIILFFVIKSTYPLYKTYQSKLDRLASVVRENLSGVRVIRAFGKGHSEKQRFSVSNDDLTATSIHVGKISALLSPMTSFVMNGVIVLVLWTSSYQINTGTLSHGVIIAFVNYITQILLALIVVSNLIIIFTKASASAARINEVLSTESSIIDGQNDISTIIAKPAIEFKDVSYSYNTTGDNVLDNISFTVNKGETIGILGSTGSGKSTLINLIPRFYDVNNGEILVNGVNIKNYSKHELRSRINLVPQKAILFTGTISENIRWGKPDATDDEVILSAKIAQADEFISKLPNGYKTDVARGGLNLSGGQKQRLTIARALIGKPEILILDDSFSALDFVTDAALRKELKQNIKDSTVLIVSQRVSTITHADKIIVLDDGRIAGIGTHDELIDSCNIYKNICSSQLSQEVQK